METSTHIFGTAEMTNGIKVAQVAKHKTILLLTVMASGLDKKFNS
jgi:hypothetical protein